MSTITSSRILRSSHFKRLQAIPWETPLHIFSHCDQHTLAAVSLVSFACWELAGPILYQDVEIVDLDGLASLFFIEIVPSSPRLQQATSLLSRIRTLLLDVRSWSQDREPRFTLPEDSDDSEDDSDDADADWLRRDPSSLLRPHRLLSLSDAPLPLPLQNLILPNWNLPRFHGQDFLPAQVFPYLSPTQITHRTPAPAYPTWIPLSALFDPVFLRTWKDLKRVVMEAHSIGLQWRGGPQGYEEVTLVELWSRLPSERRRNLELVFDFASRPAFTLEDILLSQHDGYQFTVNRVLESGGVKEETTSRIDLSLVVRVWRKDEKIAQIELEKVEEWRRKLLAIELV